jgi:hypothetical protein
MVRQAHGEAESFLLILLPNSFVTQEQNGLSKAFCHPDQKPPCPANALSGPRSPVMFMPNVRA